MIPRQRNKNSFARSASRLHLSVVLPVERRVHGLNQDQQYVIKSEINLVYIKKQWNENQRKDPLWQHSLPLLLCDAWTSSSSTIFWAFASLQLRQNLSRTPCSKRTPSSLFWGLFWKVWHISLSFLLQLNFGFFFLKQSFREQIKWGWNIILAELFNLKRVVLFFPLFFVVVVVNSLTS